jgi:aldehyde:ferredoxin oxidoreductase
MKITLQARVLKRRSHRINKITTNVEMQSEKEVEYTQRVTKLKKEYEKLLGVLKEKEKECSIKVDRKNSEIRELKDRNKKLADQVSEAY